MAAGPAHVDLTLSGLRAAHFAGTAMAAGILAFVMVVARPAMAAHVPTAGHNVVARCLRLALLALAVSMMSLVAWVGVEIVEIAGAPMIDAIRDGQAGLVLSQTRFGVVSMARAALIALLSWSLLGARRGAGWASVACAGTLLATLALTGHAGATAGAVGIAHLIGDGLHLLAAGAWFGGLAGLLVLLSTAARHGGPPWSLIAHAAARRFSTVGVVSVATLASTGLLSSWLLVGTPGLLPATDYGRLLLGKLALFAAMLGLAAVNRLRLTPRLAGPWGAAQDQALRSLRRNAAIEIALACLIFALVGALGTLHPAIHAGLPP